MNHTFIKLLFCRTLAQLGNATLRFVLLLYLLRQTGSASLYGSVSAVVMVPMLLGLLLGGCLADRFRKQHLTAAFDGLAAVCMTFAAAAVDTSSVTLFVLLTLCVLYAVDGVQQPTAQACLPLLCGASLARGNAAFQLTSTLSEMLGTGLGGLLFAPWGLRRLLLLCAGLFALVAVAENFLAVPYQPIPHAHADSPAHNGLHTFFQQNRLLLHLAVLLALLNLAVVPAFTVGVPILIIQTLSLSDRALAFTQSAMSAGNLMGSALAGLAAKRLHLKQGAKILWFLTAVYALLGLSVLPGVPVTVSYFSITLLALCMMAAAALFQILLNTALLAQVPVGKAGRTMSFITVLACLTQPVGQLLFGLGYDRFAALPCIVPLLAAGASAFISIAAMRVFSRLTDFTNL